MPRPLTGQDAATARGFLCDLFLRHSSLVTRIIQVITGVRPPGSVAAYPIEGELFLRAEGGSAPWYLVSVQLFPDPDKFFSWPRLWLETAAAERDSGWMVVFTDSDDVAAWVTGPRFNPRHGPSLRPLLMDLSEHVEDLLRPREPLLSAVAVWAARRRPLARLQAVAAQFVDDLLRSEHSEAVLLLRGLLSLGGPGLRMILEEIEDQLGERVPAWWGKALGDGH